MTTETPAVEQTEQRVLGLIDDLTPKGRRFEFADGYQDGEFAFPAVVIFEGMDAEGGLILTYEDGKPFFPTAEERYGREHWNEQIAPHCTGFIGLAADSADERPAAETAAPAPSAAPENVLSAGGEISPELLSELRNANEDFHEAREEFEQANEIAKHKKKVMETAQTALNEICDRITTMASPLPLLDHAAKEAKGTEGGNDLALLDVQNVDDSWRGVTLASLTEPGISDRYLKALAENNPPILTMGELVDWQEAKADFWAKDINGLGEVGQGEIADATMAYWERNPRRTKATAEEAKPATAEQLADLNSAASVTKLTCDGSCGWEALAERIEALQDDDRYDFANDTLQGIYDWIIEHEHATEAQKQAVENIAASVHE